MSKQEKRKFRIVQTTHGDLHGKTCSGNTPLDACKNVIKKVQIKEKSFGITLQEIKKDSNKKRYSYTAKLQKDRYSLSRSFHGGAGEEQTLQTQNLPPINQVIVNRGAEFVQKAREVQSVDLDSIVERPSVQAEHNMPSGALPPNAPKFVIITYWWGRGNLNKNLQYPCPEDMDQGETLEDYQALHEKGAYPLYKPREKFEYMIDAWKRNIESQNCFYYVQEYPEFAKPGMYQLAINAKPMFIKKALDVCSQKGFKGVVYIDGDMTVNSFPAIFNLDDIDFMARGWNIDPRSAAPFRKGEICFDPYIFETSGGIMYFGDTVYARQLLDIWKTSSAKKLNQGKADDRIISLMFNALGLYIPYNIIQLPLEYLWLTDIYGQKPPGSKKGHVIYNFSKVNGKTVFSDQPADVSGDIAFEHPACLTGEERAADQGASSNRTPPFYESMVEEKIECSRHGGVFYEWIYFYNGDDTTNQQALQSYNRYLAYMNDVMLPDPNPEELPPFYVVPYASKYGEFQKIVDQNLSNLGASIESVLNSGLKLSPNERPNVNVYVTVQGRPQNDPENIKLILSNLMKGYDVLFLPSDFDQVSSYSLMDQPAFEPYETEMTYPLVRPPVVNKRDDDYGLASRDVIRIDRRRLVPQTYTRRRETYIDDDIWQRGGALSVQQKKITDFIKSHVPVGCELVTFVTDTDEYMAEFINTMPMYFSHRSRVLRHLLLMSKTIGPSITETVDAKGKSKIISCGLNDVFRSSFVFLTRIRCKWLDKDLDEDD